MISEGNVLTVCHMTSAHESDDTRIFVKECCSLAAAGFDVTLVAKGESRLDHGVKVVGVGAGTSNRFVRMLTFSKAIYKRALRLDCDVYHFHDPELLPYGKKLAARGKKVIFDSHEDVPAQIMNKEWIPKPFRALISGLYKRYETNAVKKYAAVVTATDYIAENFKGRAKTACAIHNYPELSDIHFHDTPFEAREMLICYVGGITKTRGEDEMKAAAHGMPELRLILAGPHVVEEDGNVSYVGKLNRQQVDALYGRVRAGLLISEVSPNAVNSLPIKLFEYMAAGLPMVISNYPMWKDFYEKEGVAICVDPSNTEEVQAAIRKLVGDPALCREMGNRGKKLVDIKFNWGIEEKRLVELYIGL